MKTLLAVLFEIQHNPAVHRLPITGTSLDPQLAMLRSWQSRRLSATYADLLNTPQYAPACNFILSELYAARDFSQRDHDFERLHAVLAKFLPPQMLRLLQAAIQMNALTNALDMQLLRAMVDRLGVTSSLSAAQYAQGYRICDNYTERRLQIELLCAILEEVIQGARFPLSGMTLRLARGPALAAGWDELHAFLEHGHKAVQPMINSQKFVRTIMLREMGILDRIFNGDNDPFQKPL